MNPVEQVQQYLTAIGETTYDPAHREALMWGELREVQAAMDDWHDSGRPGVPERHKQVATINLARALCELAYVAIGTALLHGDDLGAYTLAEWPWVNVARMGPRYAAETYLMELFPHPSRSASIRFTAAYYGFGDKLEACFTAVHEANMRKLPECIPCKLEKSTTPHCRVCHGTGRHVDRDPEGRILNPAGWQPADLGPILFGGEA